MSGTLVQMLSGDPGRTDVDERQARLDSMRAEFRAAQQRRYEKRAIAEVNAVLNAAPEPAPEAEPPTRATPVR